MASCSTYRRPAPGRSTRSSGGIRAGGGRIVAWLVADRPAPGGLAGNHPVTAPPAHRLAGRRALARHPGDDDPSWSPRVPVLALLRICPPVRTPYSLPHYASRTHVRLSGKAFA